jgi:hypothetical protein
MSDKNFVLRIIKKTFREIGRMSESKNINLNFQLYNYNKQSIISALSTIYK